MITWWRDGMVRVRHKPTGITVTVDSTRSIHKNKASAMAMLKGKVWSVTRGGHFAVKDKMVRSYEAKDMDRTDIVDMPRRRRWTQW